MNYLAHLLIAGEDPALRLGGMLGDFVKGRLPGTLPADVARGVALHRKIDTFADAHPAFRMSRSRVSEGRRRYSGIMIDMFYDHLLAAAWTDWCCEPLEYFADEAYSLMEASPELLPERLGRILPAMRGRNWLVSYRDLDAISAALDGMAVHRLRQPNNLAGAGAELKAHYADFDADFRAFFPDAMEFAQQWIRSTREGAEGCP